MWFPSDSKLMIDKTSINNMKKKAFLDSNSCQYSSHHLELLEKQTRISDLEANIFKLNMLVKSGVVFLFWNSTGRLAGNSEGASRISKYKS